MKTKIILAIIGVALVAAALVSVSEAQYVGTQNTTNPTLTQGVSPCANPTGVVSFYCINAKTGEPYCYDNAIGAGYCDNGNANRYCGGDGCNGYSYRAQTQNQNQYGSGIMSQTANGMGRCR